MSTRAYIGYDMYWVGDVTKRGETCILIWQANESSLSSLIELKVSSGQILRDCQEDSSNFYHWLDFDIPVSGG